MALSLFSLALLLAQLLTYLLCFCTDVEQQISACNAILDQMGAVTACADLVGANWNCVNYVAPTRRPTSLSQSGPGTVLGARPPNRQLALSCGNSGALFCCPIWAMIRCLLQQAKVNCGRVLLSAPSATDPNLQNQDQMMMATFLAQFRARQFQPQINQLHRGQCSNYTFASRQCENVLIYIRNRELLEPIGKS